MGRISNGIGAWGSGATSSTMDEAFFHASGERGGTIVSDCAEFLSDNATAVVRSGTEYSCTGVLRGMSLAEGAGFRLCKLAIGYFNFLTIVLII